MDSGEEKKKEDSSAGIDPCEPAFLRGGRMVPTSESYHAAGGSWTWTREGKGRGRVPALALKS